MLDVLFLGDRSRAEFRDVRKMIAETANLLPILDISTALAELAKRGSAPLVVVATAYPGQFRAAQIAELRKASPFVRVVALLGSWSEGEERTGRPWPSDVRIFWHESPVWWSREMARDAADRWATPGSPLTTTRQDRILAAKPKCETAKSGGLVAVSCRDFETFAAISAALEASGYPSAWVRETRKPVLSGVATGIWDGGQLSLKEQGDLALFCRRIHPAPVVAILDFPRSATVRTAQELGAAHVFGKPYSVADLMYVLAEFGRREHSQKRPKSGESVVPRSA